MTLILTAAAVALTALFFPALTVYYANVFDYSAGIGDLLWPALVLLAVVTAVPVLIGWRLRGRARSRWLALLAMLGVAFWLQSSLLVWDYGVLDGGAIDWGAYSGRAALELLAWIGLLAAGWFLHQRIAPQAATIAVALIAVQSVSAVLVAGQASEPPSHHYFSELEAGEFSWSAEQNAIVLVLDAFQSDVFQQIMVDNPEYAEDFEGFHYFRNALSGYAKTYPSIPLMLTGQWYDNDRPITDFLADAYLEASLPRQLRDAGWDVRLYPYFERTVHYDESVADNFVRSLSSADRMGAFGEFVDVGVFRALPHVLKPLWLNDHEWRMRRWVENLPASDTVPGSGGPDGPRSEHPHEALRWLENVETLGDTRTPAPAFRFYHLLTPHAPHLINEELEMEVLPLNPAGYRRHAHATVQLIRRFLDRLRELEIYDDSFIAIVSEHGGGEYHLGVNTDLLPDTMPAPEAARMPSSHYESGLPLMLVKPAGGNGPPVINDAPVSVGDLAATIAAAADLETLPPGRDMLAVDEDESRSRLYRFYEFDGWVSDYLPDMVEYRVEGHSWLPQTWEPTGRRFEPPEEPSAAAPEEELAALGDGDVLRFDQSGRNSGYLRAGWAEPEPHGVWTSAPEAGIDVPLEQPLEDNLQLSLFLYPYTVEGELDSQRVSVSVNGVDTAEWNVTARGPQTVLVTAAEHGGAETLRLRLTLPDATAPAQFLRSTDTRQLGIALQELVLGSVPVYRPGEALAFGENGDARHYVTHGWSGAERDLRWTEGEEAGLRLYTTFRPGDGDLRLRMQARAYLAGGALEHQQVTVLAGDESVARWNISGQDWHEAVIPAGLIDEDGIVALRFRISDPTAPSSVSDSPDGRMLGMMAEQLVIEHVQ
ncbi:MAG: sulfatase-like hydrolase/transferase [Pseudomonadota bacterium]